MFSYPALVFMVTTVVSIISDLCSAEYRQARIVLQTIFANELGKNIRKSF